jgi:hypothetical protein
MNVNAGPTTSRQFVAHPPFWGAKLASKTTVGWQTNFTKSYLMMVAPIIGFTVVLGGLSYVLTSSEWMQKTAGFAFPAILLALLVAGTVVWYWRSPRKILISVTSDGLTVKKRPGDVYSFGDAQLGTWGVTGGATMGAALHLQCGPRRFILGGRDHRVGAATRLEAPDVGYGQSVDIDAWLSASDFQEILTVAGLRTGPDVRPAAPGESRRCLLYANPELIGQIGSFAFRKRQEFLQSLNQPRLAIDVGAGTIRVIDPNTNELIASSSPAHVTATPVTYRPSFWQMYLLVTDLRNPTKFKEPFMRVSVPGMPPMAIGCRVESVDPLDKRFSWPENVPTEHARIDYLVSGADWLTLVEKFGLSPQLNDRVKQN